MSAVKKYLATGISDALACFGIPAATATQVYEDISSKRANEAREILLSEIRLGNVKNIHQDDLISILLCHDSRQHPHVRFRW